MVWVIVTTAGVVLAAQACGAFIVYRFIKASGGALAKAALRGKI